MPISKERIIKTLKYLPIKYFFKPIYGGKGSILFMHKVVKEHHKKPRIHLMKANEIEQGFLEKMLIYLHRKYDIISIDEMHQRLSSKIKHKKKFIVITFDDGYKDNLTLAYPVFKKLNIPFTIYITNCYPNKTAKLWWYMLEDILLENNVVAFQHESTTVTFPSKTQKEKDSSFEKIRNIIITSSVDEQGQIFQQLEASYNKKLQSYVEKESLNWKEINTLSKDSLVTIGCHTMNHLGLNTLTEEVVFKEVVDSKKEIELNINYKPVHFAYPFGTKNEINQREVEILKSTQHFNTATTTRMGNIFKAHNNNLHALPRIQVLGTQQDLSILDMYLCGLLPAIKNKFKKVVTL